jgi:4-diphosphocytidyl-2-C-methyl-D-erythritol kinase
MPHTLTITAPAKINLYLDILGRRPDGYHDIRTVFLPLPELADTLALETGAPGIRLACDNPEVPADARNLVWKAAEAFAVAVGVVPAWSFRLEKRIPAAAGLGGGSSDAAAALAGLNRLHGGKLPPETLRTLAAKLGADVPVFLNRETGNTGSGEPRLILAPTAAIGTGVGEILEPLPPVRPLSLVLVNPLFPVATVWAYKNAGLVPRPAAPPVEGLLAALADSATPLASVASGTCNALEHAVCRKFPLLAMLRETLLELGCLAAHVSGSGGTVYGISPPGRQEEIRAAIAARMEMPLWTFASVAGG